ncbi:MULTISPECIES: hypothetical protein [Okeania]|uniref:Uncharacterized protein n=1 Tax=Okeania hirsuta TaxID=1458930 RepID=A0A3N6P918_9CYAN|nr:MULTISPECIES: hypothetical protein [Okeania]NEP42291.1 hypothetical protein [Okeania sp. SIO2H7]NET14677.1 hypothetical protein [Okeania sp. SIO1H6]NEP71659.1 hypothetical protein [Okeania sp. SIO2G5]NEP91754.1 hypothetical protein [Okeania sp. SIO2F5]NEQ89581.1 hypothetical protein [Okeania sp. SIO2G4]
MARYTGLFTVAVDVENIQLILTDILSYCGFEVVYIRGNYLMASEVHGQVIFSQLITIEINVAIATNTEKTRINIVVRNEEIPLKSDNHCRQKFDLLSKSIIENPNWEFIDSI